MDLACIALSESQGVIEATLFKAVDVEIEIDQIQTDRVACPREFVDERGVLETGF
jgi:hypothetical protein